MAIEKYHLEYSYASRRKLQILLQKYNPQAISLIYKNVPFYFERPANLLGYYQQLEELPEYIRKWVAESLAQNKTDQYGDFLEEPKFKGHQVVYKHILNVTYLFIFKTASYKVDVQP